MDPEIIGAALTLVAAAQNPTEISPNTLARAAEVAAHQPAHVLAEIERQRVLTVLPLEA